MTKKGDELRRRIEDGEFPQFTSLIERGTVGKHITDYDTTLSSQGYMLIHQDGKWRAYNTSGTGVASSEKRSNLIANLDYRISKEKESGKTKKDEQAIDNLEKGLGTHQEEVTNWRKEKYDQTDKTKTIALSVQKRIEQGEDPLVVLREMLDKNQIAPEEYLELKGTYFPRDVFSKNQGVIKDLNQKKEQELEALRTVTNAPEKQEQTLSQLLANPNIGSSPFSELTPEELGAGLTPQNLSALNLSKLLGKTSTNLAPDFTESFEASKELLRNPPSLQQAIDHYYSGGLRQTNYRNLGRERNAIANLGAAGYGRGSTATQSAFSDYQTAKNMQDLKGIEALYDLSHKDWTNKKSAAEGLSSVANTYWNNIVNPANKIHELFQTNAKGNQEIADSRFNNQNTFKNQADQTNQSATQTSLSLNEAEKQVEAGELEHIRGYREMLEKLKIDMINAGFTNAQQLMDLRNNETAMWAQRESLYQIIALNDKEKAEQLKTFIDSGDKMSFFDAIKPILPALAAAIGGGATAYTTKDPTAAISVSQGIHKTLTDLLNPPNAPVTHNPSGRKQI